MRIHYPIVDRTLTDCSLGPTEAITLVVATFRASFQLMCLHVSPGDKMGILARVKLVNQPYAAHLMLKLM